MTNQLNVEAIVEEVVRRLLSQPEPQQAVASEDSQQSSTETVIVWDELGAGEGSLIALSEGGEAAQPFHPELKPVDAYNSALLDQLDY